MRTAPVRAAIGRISTLTVDPPLAPSTNRANFFQRTKILLPTGVGIERHALKRIAVGSYRGVPLGRVNRVKVVRAVPQAVNGFWFRCGAGGEV